MTWLQENVAVDIQNAAVPRRRPEFRVAWYRRQIAGLRDHEKRNTRHPTGRFEKQLDALPVKGCRGALLLLAPLAAGAVDKLEPFASPSQLEAETSRVDRPQRVANPPAESESLFPVVHQLPGVPCGKDHQVHIVQPVGRGGAGPFPIADAGEPDAQRFGQGNDLGRHWALDEQWPTQTFESGRQFRLPCLKLDPHVAGGPTVVAAEWNPEAGWRGKIHRRTARWPLRCRD